MAAMEYNERTCIIVVEIKGANQTILMGSSWTPSRRSSTSRGPTSKNPEFGSHLNTAFILGMAKTNGSVKSSSTSTGFSGKGR